MPLYDFRKRARSWQQYLIADAQPELTTIRNATTTDQWGPTAAELQAVTDLLINSEPEFIVGLIMTRVSEYSGSKKGESTVYESVVHYVNQGNEWRIVLKCLKLLKHLVITGDDSIVGVIGEYEDTLEKVGDYGVNEADVTVKGLQRKEQRDVLAQKRQELLELLKDATKRHHERQIFVKLQAQESVENKGSSHHGDEVPSYMQDFKTKELDRHKLTNSNIKSEVRNQLGHVYHPKESLPGMYGMVGDNTPESLLEDD